MEPPSVDRKLRWILLDLEVPEHPAEVVVAVENIVVAEEEDMEEMERVVAEEDMEVIDVVDMEGMGGEQDMEEIEGEGMEEETAEATEEVTEEAGEEAVGVEEVLWTEEKGAMVVVLTVGEEDTTVGVEVAMVGVKVLDMKEVVVGRVGGLDSLTAKGSRPKPTKRSDCLV